MVLRVIVFTLAVLAGGKVLWQEHAYRSALRDTLAGAFRDRAVRACQTDSQTLKLGLPTQAWAGVDRVRVEVTASDGWLTGGWLADRNGVRGTTGGQPLIVLSLMTDGGRIACTYNVVTAVATVERS